MEQHPSLLRHNIEKLLDAAESGGDSSVITVMGKHENHRVRQDIAVASEMLGLLRHFLCKLPFRDYSSSTVLLLEPGVYFDPVKNRLVALVSIGPSELALVAYWLSETFENESIVGLPGLLALPFTIEEHDEKQWLMPEWTVMFYIDSSVEHCVPVLALKSVLDDGRFSDWVEVALERIEVFGLPTGQAKIETQRVVVHKANA